MLSPKMEKALNAQINAELYSSYLYLAMAAWCKGQNFDGMAHWLKAQAAEEYGHGMKLYGHVFERNGQVTLDAIAKPPAAWKSPLAVFEAVLAHELKVTSLIHGLVNLAAAEKDHASTEYLQWFVKEQVEEEANATGIVAKLKMVNNAPQGLMIIDSHLGQRK